MARGLCVSKLGKRQSLRVTPPPDLADVGSSPEKFLSDKVLTSDHVNSSLQRWLYLAKYGLKDRIRPPKIWFLTGLYELEGSSSVVTDTKHRSAQAGIGPALMALLAFPQGGSARSQHENMKVERVELEKRSVWAAQYQLLDAKYIPVKDNETPPPHSVRLKPRAVFSRGTERSSQAQDNFAELVLKTPDALLKEMEEEGPHSTEESWPRWRRRSGSGRKQRGTWSRLRKSRENAWEVQTCTLDYP
ncbi:MAG: hypothetical protein M1839_003197 [Geoglossum umbratile]|nr:MAG: hypothetical protein M1839_003197 [Geoglossum umbratile]